MSKKVLFSILFCIITGIIFLWMQLSQGSPLSEKQKKVALESILGRAVREGKNIPQGEKTYQGKYFFLSYPAYAQVYDKENPNISNNKNLLEYFRLDSEEPKFRFVVMVEKAEDAAVLDELSGVRTRKLKRQYIEKPLIIDGNAGVLFAKESDGIELSSFFLKEGKSFSFSMTGLDSKEIEAIYTKIMKSVRF